jgi:hypothetical protein
LKGEKIMIGIALLGAGRKARVHAKAIGTAGGRLVTVYDVVEPAAKSLWLPKPPHPWRAAWKRLCTILRSTLFWW